MINVSFLCRGRWRDMSKRFCLGHGILLCRYVPKIICCCILAIKAHILSPVLIQNILQYFVYIQYIYRIFFFSLDEDECAVDSPCSHSCNNIMGGFSCACPSGFTISTESNTCQGQIYINHKFSNLYQTLSQIHL